MLNDSDIVAFIYFVVQVWVITVRLIIHENSPNDRAYYCLFLLLTLSKKYYLKKCNSYIYPHLLYLASKILSLLVLDLHMKSVISKLGNMTDSKVISHHTV